MDEARSIKYYVWDSRQTRIEIYNYIQLKASSNPQYFMDGRLHNYFTEDLVTKIEAENKVIEAEEKIKELEIEIEKLRNSK